MSFDWIEYLEISQELFIAANQVNAKSQEGKYRATMSRAYYAAFIKARNHLRDVDNIPSPRKDGKYGHSFVVNHYANHAHFTRRRIGLRLKLLLRNRQQADYEDTMSDVERLAKQSLHLANEIIRLIATL